jgi:hypothetical protein
LSSALLESDIFNNDCSRTKGDGKEDDEKETKEWARLAVEEAWWVAVSFLAVVVVVVVLPPLPEPLTFLSLVVVVVVQAIVATVDAVTEAAAAAAAVRVLVGGCSIIIIIIIAAESSVLSSSTAAIAVVAAAGGVLGQKGSSWLALIRCLFDEENDDLLAVLVGINGTAGKGATLPSLPSSSSGSIATGLLLLVMSLLGGRLGFLAEVGFISFLMSNGM